jgi:hypothetical protein
VNDPPIWLHEFRRRVRFTTLARRLARVLVMSSILAVTITGCLAAVPIMVLEQEAAKRSPGEVRYTPAGPERPTSRLIDQKIDWLRITPDGPREVIGTISWSNFRSWGL